MTIQLSGVCRLNIISWAKVTLLFLKKKFLVCLRTLIAAQMSHVAHEPLQW